MKTLKRRAIQHIFLILALMAQIVHGAHGKTVSASSLASVFSAYTSDSEGETGFRSLNIPSGGKSESIGTACVALADDISFFDYNPASSAVLEQTEVAVFHNAWIADSALETIAATTRFGNLGLGAALKCFYVPFTEYTAYGERAASAYYSETSLTCNVAYTFLAGYSFKGISVGANAKAAWRSIPDYADSTTGVVESGSGLSQSALAFLFDAGLLVRFNAAKFYSGREPNMHIGASIQNCGISLTGFGEHITWDDPLPTRCSVGLAYRPLAPLVISAEARQYFLVDSGIRLDSQAICAGFECEVTQTFSFLAGFLLQGASPRISMGSGFSLKTVIMHVNYTFDITSSLNPVNHISLSASMKLGDRGRAAKAQAVDAHYIRGLELYAEGTREAIEAAIAEWEAALKLDRSFDPAREAKKIAEEMLTAHDTITARGKLKTK